MIMKFLNKIPAGIMIVPMFIAAAINTFFPQVLQIGSFTTASLTSAGTGALIGVQLVCLGTQLHLKEMPKVLKRGGILLLSKWAIGAVIGIVVGKMFGMAGVLGITTLAIISSITNSNGSLYLSLMTNYGDETDCAALSMLSINDGPFLTMLTLGASGLANIPIMALIGTIVPLALGMLLGNLDINMRKYLEGGVAVLVPFVGICLGGSINLSSILSGGLSGILLGVITVFVGGAFIVFCDRFLGRRPGYAGVAVSTCAGNAIAVPAAVALVDPSWAPYVEVATTQVAAACVFSAIVVPFLTNWWAKKYGCPKFPLTKEVANETTANAN